MVTQKDIHNIIVENASDYQKMYLSMECGGEIEKIKEVEQRLANIVNEVAKSLQNSGVEYLNNTL